MIMLLILQSTTFGLLPIDGPGWQMNFPGEKGRGLGNYSVYSIFFERGKLRIGTSVFMSLDTPDRVLKDSLNGKLYHWNIYTSSTSLFPLYVSYRLWKSGEANLYADANLSLWGQGSTFGRCADSTDSVLYNIQATSDKMFNLSLSLKYPLFKGLYIYLTMGSNVFHLNRKNVSEDINEGLNRYGDYLFQPYIGVKTGFSSIVLSEHKQNTFSRFSFLTTSITSGVLRTGFMLTYADDRYRNDLSRGTALLYAGGSGISTSLLSSSLFYLSLKNGRENDLLDCITIGISSGIASGLINGYVCDWIDFDPFGMVHYQPIIEGVLGGITGLVYYILQ